MSVAGSRFVWYLVCARLFNAPSLSPGAGSQVLVLTLDSIGLYEEGSTHVGHFYVYSYTPPPFPVLTGQVSSLPSY